METNGQGVTKRTLTLVVILVLSIMLFTVGALGFIVNRTVNELAAHQRSLACVLTLPQDENGRDPELVELCFHSNGIEAPEAVSHA